MKALVGAFNQEKALVGAFSVIVKTNCETDGSFYNTNVDCSCVCWSLVSWVLEVEVGLSLHLGTHTNIFTFPLTVAVLLFIIVIPILQY